MSINAEFNKLFEEYLTTNATKLEEGQLSSPIYCGSSIVKDIDEDKIYLINLFNFSIWAENKFLTAEQAKYIRNFIQEKINNGTLYTPAEMIDYPLTKRFQLFINSNIAEHAIVVILGGKLLAGNDELTIDSTAIIGDDGCAAADTIIDGIETEVKVTHDSKTRNNILAKAHKKPVVAIYIISPETSNHWEFYIRSDNGNYASVDFAIGHNYSNFDGTDHYNVDITNKAIFWQSEMNIKAPKLPLLYFKDLSDGSLSITFMHQK